MANGKVTKKMIIEMICQKKGQKPQRCEVTGEKDFADLAREGMDTYLASYTGGFKYSCLGMRELCLFCKMTVRMTVEYQIDDPTAFNEIYSKA